jgi:hypothetical protein
MGDDAGARADLVTLLGRLAGDITSVVISASREIATAVVRQLPGLLAPITSFLEPLLVEARSSPRIEVLPHARKERLLATVEPASAG